ncbi:hypothetical protein F5B18DRAFT_656343 [Nemania serpens]|nr:hypothetical protein F5B18DRAFT_656343 [Nemania serpens]
MSGFKVIGVVLGSSPLLISALEHYDTDYVALCKGGIIDPKDMKPLLEDPFRPLWQDSDIKAPAERRLDHTLENFQAQVHSMKEAVEEIRLKLGLGPIIRIDDGPIGKREMIKIAAQFFTHEDS